MNRRIAWFVFSTVLLAISWCQAALAVQGEEFSYNFMQTGYSDGATVTGAFTGVDLDGNGILVHFPGQVAPPVNTLELTEFTLHFSGNSLAAAFDLSLEDLYGFVYELETDAIGDDPATDPNHGDLSEGIGAIGAEFFYTSGLGPNGIIGGYVGGPIEFEDVFDLEEFALDSSPNLVLVARVPEPPTVLMLLGGNFFLWPRRR